MCVAVAEVNLAFYPSVVAKSRNRLSSWG